MEKLNLVTAVGVFVATALSDIIWVFYIRRTSSGHALQAAIASAIIVVLGGLVVTSYVENMWYLAPTALGAFAGTIVTVRYDNKREKKIQQGT